MQGALKKFGFRECGVIHLERGAERIAFDCTERGWILKNKINFFEEIRDCTSL